MKKARVRLAGVSYRRNRGMKFDAVGGSLHRRHENGSLWLRFSPGGDKFEAGCCGNDLAH